MTGWASAEQQRPYRLGYLVPASPAANALNQRAPGFKLTHSAPSVHAHGHTPHHMTLWIPSKGSLHLIDFEDTGNLLLYGHVDRAKEIVLEVVTPRGAVDRV
jgi:glyoxylase-like metal-dependent hydrolase (beta-lactamase superfamily II)